MSITFSEAVIIAFIL